MSEQLDLKPFREKFPSGSAVFSKCERYRYTLTRTWDRDSARVCFVMLNPSTADAFRIDPTLRRCIDFAQLWRFGSLVLVNLFAYRATDPKELRSAKDIVGEDNDRWVERSLSESAAVVLGWGSNGDRWPDRVAETLDLVEASGHPPTCLGTTKSGQPRHPLYVHRTTSLTAWSPRV